MLHQGRRFAGKVSISFLLPVVFSCTQLLCQSAHSQNTRLWKDSTGKFEVEARVCRFDGKEVVLRRTTGKIITVPLEILSRSDQSFLNDNLVLRALHFQELQEDGKAYNLIKSPNSAAEKAILASLILRNRRPTGVDEFDPKKAGEILDEIRPELEAADDPLSWFLVAQLYLDLNQSDDRQLDKAVSLLKRCAEQDEPYGINRLASLYVTGKGVEQNLELALKLYETTSTDFGSVLGLCNVGFLKKKGPDAIKDEASGERIIQQAATKGMLFAMCLMAEMSRKKAASVEVLEVTERLKRAASNGDQKARHEVRSAEINAKKRLRIINVAEEYAKRAGDGGHARGLFELALIKLQLAAWETDQVRVRQLPEEATELILRAATRDHPKAVVYLARHWLDEGELEKAKSYADQIDRIPTIGLNKEYLAETKELVAEKLADKSAHERLLKTTPLIVESWRWQRTASSFVEVVGEVTNNSGKKLDTVVALAVFKTADGEVITTDTAVIEYDPILAGQKSPFKIITRWNPAMQSCNLSFKFLLGGAISSISREKK